MNKSMHQSQPTVEQLLAALGQHLKINLQPDNGVCALFNSQHQEVCIIEFLPQNGNALLHCAIETPRHAADRNHQLLKLNFQADTLHGCWLALDENDTVRLCTQCPFEFLTERTFCHWVIGFIQQVNDTRLLLDQPA